MKRFKIVITSNNEVILHTMFLVILLFLVGYILLLVILFLHTIFIHPNIVTAISC